jgi:hypothetical protein
MKASILLISTFSICSFCFAQEHLSEDSIQLCYQIGSRDHRVTIYFEGTSFFCQRICYIMSNNSIGKYVQESLIQSIFLHYQEKGIVLDLNTEESRMQAIRRYYSEYDL